MPEARQEMVPEALHWVVPEALQEMLRRWDSMTTMDKWGDTLKVRHDKKCAFTLAEGATHVGNFADQRRIAFTLAEVLITLSIIGVVAAMTLPGLIKGYEKQVTVNKLKKVYSVLNQMVARSYNDNGPATSFLTSGETVTEAKTEQFFNTYILPYFDEPKVANNKFYNSGRPFKYRNSKTLDLAIYTSYKDGRILFKTKDGTIYYMDVMAWDTSSGTAIAKYDNFIKTYVDINGVTEPNTLGKDVFIFVANLTNNKVVPNGYDGTPTNINNNCKTGSGTYCAAKIMQDGWEIKDDYGW